MSDLDDVSIWQTEDGYTSDIRINYISDVSNVRTSIYDQANPPGKKDVNILYIICTYYIDDFIILFALYLVVNIIWIIKLFM